ncbi:MAG: hypothetical protein BGO28_04010 [Alphaproteobacteria bacterium 43-37]|nr:MAG: hypothetical protein BGO28_04010 [Alphaproteobacteria bacterium 43-37]
MTGKESEGDRERGEDDGGRGGRIKVFKAYKNALYINQPSLDYISRLIEFSTLFAIFLKISPFSEPCEYHRTPQNTQALKDDIFLKNPQ